jgi:transcriptional regulator with PAS, ATPase and Fis domain
MSGPVLAKTFSSIPDPRSAIRLVGTSKAWCHVLERAARVAATDVTTCLQGESGTGKEVIARFIHASSPRSHGPFIAINRAALPDQLVESELFGFERGAFTSAQQSKPGQIELAKRRSETRPRVFTVRSSPLTRHNTASYPVNGS